MSDPIDEIIRGAMQRGEFDNLAGTGKKLSLDEYFETPEDSRVGYALLKSTNFQPEEVRLLQEIANLEEKIRSSSDEEKIVLQKQLNDKRLSYNMLMDRMKGRRG